MDIYIGQILLVGFPFTPVGFVACNGSLLPISEYETLFNLIGTTFGGDGQTSFAVPDLRGRVPVHAGALSGGGTYPIGMTAGLEAVTLTSTQMPSHSHTVNCNGGQGGTGSPTGAYVAGAGLELYGTGATVTMGASTSAAGSSGPHENRQPFVAMQYVIATEGIYPTQN